MSKDDERIEIDVNGPYIVHGDLPIHELFVINGNDRKPNHYEQGEKNLSQGKVTALCRCGMSKNKPYCDGTHVKREWKERLTATNLRFMDNVRVFEGSVNTLRDHLQLCSGSRFCEIGRGVWDMVRKPMSDTDTEMAIKATQLCPSGRLVIQDAKTNKILEPKIDPSIGIIEDTPMEVSGPLWVRGGIKIVTSEGVELERRNRVTLCRCGSSEMKPYCDGNHFTVLFKDDNFL